MADASAATNPAIKDSQGLKQRLKKAERRKKFEAVGLVMPLLALMIVFYFVPIAMMLYRSIDNKQMRTVLPRTADIIMAWDGNGLPGEPVYKALAADLKEARKKHTIAKAARRLNFDRAGFASLISRTGRKVSRLDIDACQSCKDTLIGIDKRWGEKPWWTVMQRGLKDYTLLYLLSAVDLRYDLDNKIVRVPEEEAIYTSIIARTIYISASVTLLCLLLGFPIAYYLAQATPRVRNLLMIVLLLVFWTSLLVRTLSWILVLQDYGVVNSFLMWSGITSKPVPMVFNRFAVYVAMTHVLLPFMVLPLYSVMRVIPKSYVRAAHSLGATPFHAFWSVYVPQTLPGIGAGALMVFIQALGYYITPALVGGPRDQMISYFVAFFVNERVNWSMASALGLLLLVLTGTMYLLFGRKVNIANMKMG
ncbi:MAG TPA: ABC transporter permease [Rhodobacteraceae bacterium]|nr:ABC transporter permease [Paracoccaceae bacterium]